MDHENSFRTQTQHFQRSLLRKLLNIRCPQTISNRNLYEQTNETLSSKKIKSRRLSWLGHLLRLPEDTPARQALAEAQRQVRRPRGRPKTTWISAIQKELKEIHEDLNLLAGTEKAQDRTLWMTLRAPCQTTKSVHDDDDSAYLHVYTCERRDSS